MRVAMKTDRMMALRVSRRRMRSMSDEMSGIWLRISERSSPLIIKTESCSWMARLTWRPWLMNASAAWSEKVSERCSAASNSSSRLTERAPPGRPVPPDEVSVNNQALLQAARSALCSTHTYSYTLAGKNKRHCAGLIG